MSFGKGALAAIYGNIRAITLSSPVPWFLEQVIVNMSPDMLDLFTCSVPGNLAWHIGPRRHVHWLSDQAASSFHFAARALTACRTKLAHQVESSGLWQLSYKAGALSNLGAQLFSNWQMVRNVQGVCVT